MEHEFNIFTDFKQFVVFDATADWGDLHERWTEKAVEAMFIQGEGYIAVGTARAFHAPVLVRSDASAPAAGSIDRTAQGVLALPSGTLVVSGVTDGGARGGTVSVAPGTYRVSVDYINLGSVDAEEITGDDRYVVTLSGPTQLQQPLNTRFQALVRGRQ